MKLLSVVVPCCNEEESVELFYRECTGVLGQYLAKTYMEVKKRPIYLIKENTLKS